MSIIFGKRVRLRGAERSDLEKFIVWINDPKVTAGLALFLPMSSVDEEKWFENAMQRPQEEKPLAIDMKDGTDWRLIGNSSFETLNLNRIYLRVYANNKRAIRVYEKVGFVHEGRMRQAAYKNGEYSDVLYMSVLREEWDASIKEG